MPANFLPDGERTTLQGRPLTTLLRDCLAAMGGKFAFVEMWSRERLSSREARAPLRAGAASRAPLRAGAASSSPSRGSEQLSKHECVLGSPVLGSQRRSTFKPPAVIADPADASFDDDTPKPLAPQSTSWISPMTRSNRSTIWASPMYHEDAELLRAPEEGRESLRSVQHTRRVLEPVVQSDAELGANLVFDGHSAEKTSLFHRAGLLPELGKFKESAAERAPYSRHESIPGICWDNGKIEKFDLRREQFLDSTIQDDSRTQRAKILFDVVVAVPVFDLVHKQMIVAVLVFYRLRGDEAEGPGRFVVKDSLASLLYHAATIAPRALKLQYAQLAFQQRALQQLILPEWEAEVAQTEEAAKAEEAAMGAQAQADEADRALRTLQDAMAHVPMEAGRIGQLVVKKAVDFQVAEAARARDEAAQAVAMAEAVSRRLALQNEPPDAPSGQEQWWRAYLEKWNGQGASPQPGADASFSAMTALWSLLTLYFISVADFYLRSNWSWKGSAEEEQVLFAIVGSFAASIALVFSTPAAPVAQPRNIMWGHVICCVWAILVDYLTNKIYWPIIPQWVANALVPTLGIVSMSYTGTTHPPAAACATVYIFDSTGVVKNLGWMFILFPVLFDCIIVMIMGVLCNNLAKSRQYPLAWNLNPFLSEYSDGHGSSYRDCSIISSDS